uniref:Guanylate cyclase n=1 Tax=Ditylenchus dipsaci TaxID=166011 RepID=A0A915CMZ7_9BILA
MLISTIFLFSVILFANFKVVEAQSVTSTTTTRTSTTTSITASPVAITSAVTTGPRLQSTTLFPPTTTLRKIKVGMLIPNGKTELEGIIGYSLSAGAIIVALEQIIKDGLLPNTNFTFVWYFDQCDESLSAGYTSKLIKEDQVDVIVGPACTALMSSDLDDKTRYPTLTLNAATTWSIVIALISVFQQYGWNEFAFFYTIRRSELVARCSAVQSDINDIPSRSQANMTLVYKRNISNDTYDQLKTVLGTMKTKARIIVACLENNVDRRSFMLAASQMKLDTDEYVYIFIETKKQGFGVPPLWIDTNTTNSGDDEVIHKMCDNLLVIDSEINNDTIDEFRGKVLQNIHEWPFYCDTCNLNATKNSVTVNAPSLADVFYNYGLSLNRSIASYGEAAIKNGTLLSLNSKGEFAGFSGRVIMNERVKSSQQPTKTKLRVFGRLERASDLFPDLFVTLTGALAQPHSSNKNLVYVIIGIALILAVIVFITWIIYLVVRNRTREMQRLDALWQIHYTQLATKTEKESIRSVRSIQSHQSNSSTMSHKRNTDNINFCYLNNLPVIARKHSPKFVPDDITEQDRQQFRFMRQLDHANLNKFWGLCYDSAQFLSVWQYCERGTLNEVIELYSMSLDGFILTSMIRDICEGLMAIHNSTILHNCHGSLTSNCILVNDRWQLKVQYYGLHSLRAAQHSTEHNDSQIGNLWTAPEILRDRELLMGTQKADIYSFAIICSEIVTRKVAWNLADSNENEDQILYRIRRGGNPPSRPTLSIDPALELNAALPHLIQDCWQEEPERRPKVQMVRDALKSMLSSKATNLMDYIFTLLENNAAELEQDVEERTKELVLEKKKADILLYRLLPRMVADKLNIFFGCGFIYYISWRSTPLQVVNLLNDLYTTFDMIIDQHGVYKVETIGDGLHVVSGLPVRNGDEHVKEIIEMSFGFLRSIKAFKVAHLPDYQINIRVGIHTGPCVAGVVGLTAPRYCVFGDTVNLAARMESSSKPGRIHISAETNRYLTEILKDNHYRTESRGEVMIKGSGPAETFFLLSPDEPNTNGSTDA